VPRTRAFPTPHPQGEETEKTTVSLIA